MVSVVATETPRLPAGFLARPFAHRGLHDAAAGVIENSHAACAAAVSAGYGVEIDVQLSADGEAIVFHDDTLDRLTAEAGPVRSQSAEALQSIALAGSTDRIPTLQEILELIAGRAAVLVEIKDQSGAFGPEVGPLEARTAALLADYFGPCAVMSFNPHAVAWFQRHAPDLARGVVGGDFAHAPVTPERRAALAQLEAAPGLAVDFVSYDWRGLPNPATDRVRAAGAPLLCWTIDSPETAAAAEPHCDQITFEGFRP